MSTVDVLLQESARKYRQELFPENLTMFGIFSDATVAGKVKIATAALIFLGATTDHVPKMGMVVGAKRDGVDLFAIARCVLKVLLNGLSTVTQSLTSFTFKIATLIMDFVTSQMSASALSGGKGKLVTLASLNQDVRKTVHARFLTVAFVRTEKTTFIVRLKTILRSVNWHTITFGGISR